MIRISIEIDIEGVDDSDVKVALEHVCGLIHAGHTSGAGPNDGTGGTYSFTVIREAAT